MSDKTDHPPIPEKFAALGVRPSILRALAELQFHTPSEIQSMLIPQALASRDVLGQARTGTGKTAAFAIPLLQLARRGTATEGLVLVPTRELAVQVESEFHRIGQHTPIRTVAIYGGQKIAAQVKRLHTGPELLVGTPGRVIDLLERGIIHFGNIRFVVLDEVDRMLDIGFRDDIRRILSQIRTARSISGSRPSASAREETPTSDARPVAPDANTRSGGPAASGAPDVVQTIFVSATISEEIERLARQYMRGDVVKLVAPGADEKPTVEKVEQYYLSAQPWDKYRLLKLLLEREKPELGIIFTRTKHGADKLARKLHADGIECKEIHGDLAQSKRDRVMKSFRHGKFDLLIATDLASRGIDVQDVTHIINYDIPEDPEVYVHRVGRTARMGAQGKAFTFVSRDQGPELTRIENLINMEIPQLKLEGFEPSPPPADWRDYEPATSGNGDAGPPQLSRFERPLHAASGTDATATRPVLRTLGSKIPVSRRKKRLR